MMKITRTKKGYLFSPESRYAYARGDREIGRLVDPGNDDVFTLDIDGHTYRIERTKSGIATGTFSGLRNLLNAKATGEFRLVDGTGAEVATARQPGFFEYHVASGRTVLSARGKSLAKLDVSDGTGAIVGDLKGGPWKFMGPPEWLSSLPDTVDPLLEAFLLFLYAMSAKRAEAASSD